MKSNDSEDEYKDFGYDKYPKFTHKIPTWLILSLWILSVVLLYIL